MRVKLQTNDPLPEYRCWFAVQGDPLKQTVHDLRKQIVKQLSIKTEPSLIQLSIDGFNLLPQVQIEGLLRDGDLIHIEEDKFKSTEKKRKSRAVYDTESVEKMNNTFEEPALKKIKKSDKRKDSTDSKKKKISKPPAKRTKKTKEKKLKTGSRKEKDKKEKRKQKKEEEEDKQKQKKGRKAVVESETSVDDLKNIPLEKTETSQLNEQVNKAPQGLPFQGLRKTQKRNCRRRLLKKRLKAKKDSDVQGADQPKSKSTQQHTETTEVISIAVDEETNGKAPPTTSTQQDRKTEELNIPSAQLLKKNKNKKKNHLKDNKAGTKHHVHFESTPDDSNINSNNSNSSNPHGRAFITYSNIETYKRKNTNRDLQTQYPVNTMPTLFYAQQPLMHSNTAVAENDSTIEQPPTIETGEQVDKVSETSPHHPSDEVETTKAVQSQDTQMQHVQPVNYDEYPVADFENNIPSIGDRLAVKTLELTANYTPEISDWKQVILKELNNGIVTFEYIAGFKKESIKGGKFDIYKHRKRFVDDEGIEIDQVDNNEDEEEDEEEETVATFAIHDIFDMRNMTKQNI
ncbi:hypothetical protein BDF20DRAFT_833370 [Mycotypha africana]|uniref:uncharacterized protein n=1 Tax=Mycotypha africana TaxID=64632 RepID=UPI00230014C3|nr:uncharacterized protein BDF20DRAFT_833370 [Mycotypha africana]KAI8988527.1 hypothetical protein BDF20DRAFT_833370 [Mycotypha africana]